MRELSANTKHSMRQRILTGVLMFIIGVPCVLFGGWFYFVLVAFLAIVAIHEFISAPNRGRFNILVYIVVYIATLSFIFWHFVKDQAVFNSIFEDNLFMIEDLRISTTGIAVYFILLFSATLISKKFTVADATFLFTMGIYIGLAFMCFYYIRYLPNSVDFYQQERLSSSLLMFYVIIGTAMNDIGAYFIGVMFGKHKMAPRISPKKTWEGVIGGIVFSIIFSILFAFVCDLTGHPILPGVLDFDNYNYIWIIVISIIIPIASDMGDLFFSAIKRSFSIKDFGRIFPGHGGVLDRIDSLSFVCIIVSIMTFFVTNGWTFI
ncbi:MAG: phosphatidate cytidylyltransferase [Bacilli bacterium]